MAIDNLLRGLPLFPKAFDNAFAYLVQREGYYAHVKGDRGGMTYMGVARTFWPQLTLWVLIDAYVERLGRSLKWNERIDDPIIEARVKAFYYQNFWKPLRADKLASTSVAEFLFDSYVHSGNKAIKWLQEAVNEVGAISLKVDRQLGPKTLAAANACNQERLFNSLKERRRQYLEWLADNVAGQDKFKRGWLRRVDNFAYSAEDPHAHQAA